jgi:uncharacterized repeat protein (TIGR03803 family)
MNSDLAKRRFIQSILAVLLSFTLTAQAEYRVLHQFAGGTNNGATPYGSLICSDSVFYGATFYGGGSNLGTIFRMNSDGSQFQLLHSFVSDASDGSLPLCSLLLCDSTLYGMTAEGGDYNKGVIFAIDVPVTCDLPPAADLNSDCKVDFQDFALFADEWLDCGLEPPSACYQ